MWLLKMTVRAPVSTFYPVFRQVIGLCFSGERALGYLGISTVRPLTNQLGSSLMGSASTVNEWSCNFLVRCLKTLYQYAWILSGPGAFQFPIFLSDSSQAVWVNTGVRSSVQVSSLAWVSITHFWMASWSGLYSPLTPHTPLQNSASPCTSTWLKLVTLLWFTLSKAFGPLSLSLSCNFFQEDTPPLAFPDLEEALVFLKQSCEMGSIVFEVFHSPSKLLLSVAASLVRCSASTPVSC